MREYSKTSTFYRNIIRVLLVFSAICCMAGQAMAVELYVDAANGNDGNTGTSGAPFKSLSQAISLLSDGDVVYVAAGTYSIGNTNEDDASSTAHTIDNASVTFKGAGALDVVLDGTGATNWTTGLTLSAAADNVTVTGIGFSNFTSSGIWIDGGENVKILDCAFSDNVNGINMEINAALTQSPVIAKNTMKKLTSYGIYLYDIYGSGISPVITDNDIEDVSNATGSGIYLSSYGGISGEIYKNEIRACTGYGIYLSAGDGSMAIKSNSIDSCGTGIKIECSYTPGTFTPLVSNNLITNFKVTTLAYGIEFSDMGATSGSFEPSLVFNTIDGSNYTEVGIHIPNISVITPNTKIRYNNVTNCLLYGVQKDVNLSTIIDIDYNNAYGNGVNYQDLDATEGLNNIEANPLYASDFSIPDNSPCADAVDADLVSPGLAESDIMGASRPRAATSGAVAKYDIGCYEYPYQEYDFTMPPGTGLATDYRLMTLPMTSEQTFSTLFQSAFGTYDTEIYRIFIYEPKLDAVNYIEMTETNFDSAFANWQGRSFWVISKTAALPVQTHTFSGNLVGNKEPFTLFLSHGWNLIALPWPKSSANNDDIELANIMVDGGTGMYSLTDTNNNVTQKGIWSYTASGYTQMTAATAVMVPGQGYWLYVETADAKAMVPPDNMGTYFVAPKTSLPKKSVKKQSSGNGSLTPPPPPGLNLTVKGDNGCFIGAACSTM